MRSRSSIAVILCGASILIGCTSEATGGGGGTSGGNGGTSGGTSDPYANGGDPGATRPPPVISTIAPLAGDYGTLVTVTGDNFDASDAALVLDGPGGPISFTKPDGSNESTPSDVVMAWSKTSIQFRYPFPAEGAVHVTSGSGSASGASFAPSWRPGTPISGTFGRRELLDVVSPSAGTIVAAFDGATGAQILVAGPDGAVHAKPFDRGANALVTMSLYAKSDGTIDGMYDADGELHHLVDAANAATTESTGVAALDAAGGSDATGAYAWIRKSNGTIARVRAPSWSETGESIADPTPSSAPGPSMGVAADQSLFVAWGYNDTGSFPLYDYTAWPMIAELRVGQNSFDTARPGGGGADDVMVWTRILPGPGGRVRSYYCANDTGLFESASLDCREGYIGAGTAPPDTSIVSDYVVGFGASNAIAASCDVATSTLKLGPEDQTAAQTAIVWPCPSILTVAADATGVGTVLVSSGNFVYAPRAR